MPSTVDAPTGRPHAPAASKVDRHAAVLALLIGWTLVGLAGQLHLLLTDTLEHSVDLLFDDAYYYLGVAWNLGHGHGSKFTEPLATNGYHPLWLLTLAGLTAALDLSKTALVAATLVMTALVKCLAYALFGAGGKDAAWRTGWRTAGRIALFIAISKFGFVFSSGLETTLFLLVVPWLLRLAKTDGWSRRHALTVGAALGIAFLTRLDALALDAALLLLAVATRRASVKAALVAALPLVATVAVYVAVNQHFFGTPLPLSGQAKSIGSHFGGNLATSLDYAGSLRWSGLMLLIWGAARLTVAPRLALGGFELAALGATLVACALYYGLLSGWPIWPWYLWPNALFSVFATIAGGLGLLALGRFGIERLGRWTGVTAARAAVGAVVLVVVGSHLFHLARSDELVAGHLQARLTAHDPRDPARSTFNRQNVALIPWLVDRYPQGATIAIGDRAGGLGYWMPSNFSMVQLEGLVADKAFLTSLATGQLVASLNARHVDLYIADRPRAFAAEGRLGFVEPIQPRLTGGPLNVLCFRDGDQLLSQDYHWADEPQLRRVYAWTSVVACPAALLAQIDALKPRYDGIRSYSGLR